MLRLTIRIADRSTPLVLTVSPSVALLIGRDPAPSRLRTELPAIKRVADQVLGAGPAADTRQRLELVRIDSQQVSANHLLVVQSASSAGLAGGVSLWDLGSRNGSSVRLVPGEEIRVPSASAVCVELASGAEPDEAQFAWIRQPEWSTEKDFSRAVAAALSEWLSRTQVQLKIEVGPLTMAELDGSSFLLADGSELHLVVAQPGGTQEHRIRSVCDRVRSYVHEQNVLYEQLQHRVDGMIVASRSSREVLGQIAEAAARSLRTILIGPTGVGKEWLARCYHRYSPRQNGPFATLNCALLDRELLYAQIFGARKGSFTGATTDVIGVVEAANGGTLFLDELGEMPMDVQKSLLRFLDSRGEYRRLGEPHERRVDIQIVCATNVSIDDPVHRQNRFREDLWYRLSSVVVQVPPLCHRSEDILAFLRSRLLQPNLSVADALDPQALELILKDSWPGNFRELGHFIDRLPLVEQPHSIDRATCARMRAQGKSSPQVSEADDSSARQELRSPPAPLGSQSAQQRLLETRLNWRDIASTAVSAFLEDNEQAAMTWGQLQELVESYLKPIFVARVAAIDHELDAGKPVNYSAIARRINVADGTTIKLQLSRYKERFHGKASPNP